MFLFHVHRQLLELEPFEALWTLFSLNFYFFFDFLLILLYPPLFFFVHLTRMVNEHVLVFKHHGAKWTFKLPGRLLVKTLQISALLGSRRWCSTLLWILQLLFIFLLFVALSTSTANEHPEQLVSKWEFLIVVLLLFDWLFWAPVETKGCFSDLLILFGFCDWLTVMQVFKSMLKTDMHLALRTLETIDVVELGSTLLALAMWTPTILCPLHLWISFVLLQLALSGLDMLIPHMGRRYTYWCLALQTQTLLANRTENYKVVVYGIWVVAAALVIVRTAMFTTVHFVAEFALERQEVLLGAELHSAVGAKIGKFHLFE